MANSSKKSAQSDKRNKPGSTAQPGTAQPGTAQQPAAKQATSPSAARPAAAGPTQEQIAKRAYQIFEARGAQHGRHAEDWKQAEQELKLGTQ
jgi:hypothetical protein